MATDPTPANAVAMPERFLGVWSSHNLDLIAIAFILLFILGLSAVCSIVQIFIKPQHWETYAALFTLFVTVLSGALGALFSLAHTRLGVVDTITSDILSIGKVFGAANILDEFDKLYDDLKEHEGIPHGFAAVARKEEYFTVFHANLSNLGSLKSSIVTNVTAFYTFLKAARDATGAMELWSDERYTSEMKRKDIINVVYLCLLSAISGRISLEELYEDDNSRKFAQNEFCPIEQKALDFLNKNLDPADLRRRRIVQSRNCCTDTCE